MAHRKHTREEALGEYLVYRKRIRELLDMAQIAMDIKKRKYQPRDLLGRGPDRFSETVGDILIGLFASFIDPQTHALNVFDVWIVLFPGRRDEIEKTREKIAPRMPPVRDYRNDIVAHANKNPKRYIRTRVRFYEKRKEIVEVMQSFMQLAADLLRQEAIALPNLSAEAEPILKAALPNPGPDQIEQLQDYFLGGGPDN